MSIVQFTHLSEDEKNVMYRMPAIVTYLIGGVDGKFDSNEEAQAKHVVHFRTATGDPILFEYFREVETDFQSHLRELIKEYGNLQPEARTEVLSGEVAKLDEILPKIDSIYARVLLKSLRSLAMSVAKASGGILGFLEGTYEEKNLAGLGMVTYQP